MLIVFTTVCSNTIVMVMIITSIYICVISQPINLSMLIPPIHLSRAWPSLYDNIIWSSVKIINQTSPWRRMAHTITKLCWLIPAFRSLSILNGDFWFSVGGWGNWIWCLCGAWRISHFSLVWDIDPYRLWEGKCNAVMC